MTLLVSAQWRCVATGTATLVFFLLAPLQAQVLSLNDTKQGSGGAIRRGDVLAEIEIHRRPLPEGKTAHKPVVRVTVSGKMAGQLTGAERTGSTRPEALLQVAEMDPSNPYPEVLLSSFTGGAHCCNETLVLSSDASGTTWHEVRLGDLNGAPHPASDPIGSGRYVLVDVDNRFLYMFASYAGSSAPVQIWQLEGDRFIDVSHRREYLPIHRRRLKEMAGWFQEPNHGEVNGFLAAYVANKALVGEFDDGWQRMLQRYDHHSDWGLHRCEAGYDEKGLCKVTETTYTSFPEALKAFLQRTGYIKK